ncbi:uncharacterized protein Z519_02401 [Cladophialophora bantiana CBS 173.52]|uniref:Tail specific protease domain-containing protein n=1 Tax=Cladophialophora bantiana (strain ATCC 10958 / CBS 173.52 / CDC B-1940 / NIH 8579) TaxID=1442370 RepID=A0A0D2I1I9_CLAB1|nr:uncharacterized protein Z519_02401 [Cladophialophora bantiana CBS 173.52]KIW97010.1 hypothetical protein Z519_02401 [Cladophialophora bantiana CBS 173.52]
MSETAQLSTQQTLSRFLQGCRETNKTHLIVDVSQNGGGTIAVAYGIFKQLFPTLEPYLGAQSRAHEQYWRVDILGSYFTRIARQVEKQQPGNVTAPNDVGGYQSFDVSVLYNDSGVRGDNFTNQYQLDLSNADYDEATGGIVVTGYANNSNVAPQPFLPENIMAFSDWFCGSACTIFIHLLKYQGKTIGGVKDCFTGRNQKANLTALKDLADYGNTLLLRDTQGLVQVNFQNAIAQYDQSQTPLQFVYEATDCRLWYQVAHARNISALWQTVADQAFGLNGQERFSLCVPESTNHPSSLSGNQTLYQGGQIANVTGHNPGDEDVPSNSQRNGSASMMSAANLSSMVLGMLLAVMSLL